MGMAGVIVSTEIKIFGVLVLRSRLIGPGDTVVGETAEGDMGGDSQISLILLLPKRRC